MIPFADEKPVKNVGARFSASVPSWYEGAGNRVLQRDRT